MPSYRQEGGVREMDFTLEDVGNPLVFAGRVSIERMYWLDERFVSLLVLLEIAERARPKRKVAGTLLVNATRAVEGARGELLRAEQDIQCALMGASWPSLRHLVARPRVPSDDKLPPFTSSLRIARKQMTRLRSDCDLLLVFVLVMGRACRKVRPEPIAKAERAVRKARRKLEEARAEVERLFYARCEREVDAEPGRGTS